MDWDAHAQDYWKDKPSAQAKKHPSKEKKIMIAIGAVIAVLILFGASYLVRRGSTSEQEKAEKGGGDMTVSLGLVHADEIYLSDCRFTSFGPMYPAFDTRI